MAAAKDKAEEAPSAKDVKATLVEQAEALLHPPVAGYDAAQTSFDEGVQAVIDLIKAYKG